MSQDHSRRTFGPDAFSSALDRRLGALQPSHERRMRIRSAITKEEKHMQKKYRLSAAVLALTIALAGIAAAAGLDLFRFFADEQDYLSDTLTSLAPLSAPVRSVPAVLSTGPDSAATGEITNAYYDGRFLVVAHSLRGSCAFSSAEIPSSLPEGALSIGEMDDSREQAARERWAALLGLVSPESRKAMQDFSAAVAAGQPACLAYTVANVDPRTSLAGMGPYYFGMGGHSAYTLEDGTQYTIDIYPYPLIREARDLDALDIAIGLDLTTRHFYFDGERFFDLAYADEKNAVQMTAQVERSDAERHACAGEGEWLGAHIKAEGHISGALGAVSLQAGSDVFSLSGTDFVSGSKWSMLIVDQDGDILETASLFPVDQPGAASARMLTYVIAIGPETPEKLLVYPYKDTGAQTADGIMLSCEPIEMQIIR